MMISVEEAEKIVLGQVKNYGTEELFFETALGRVLAQDIIADRDLPPFNRVTMDGIALKHAAFEKGIRNFFIKATQAAGDKPCEIDDESHCIEIMTGAALPSTADTVIPYEQLDINNGHATVKEGVIAKPWQNIHLKAKDKKQGGVLVSAGRFIDAQTINIAAAVGQTSLVVQKLPTVVIISTGDELVAVEDKPLPYQLRRSNNYAIQAVLAEYGVKPAMLHLPDEPVTIKLQLQNCLQQYDVILLSGGVSMGKFDYVPRVLDELRIEKLFHKVQQRPGKPFWFGKHGDGTLVFAFPGNPVSTFMCLHRYFIPWLATCLGVGTQKYYAVLNNDVVFTPALQYFMQVFLHISAEGKLLAEPFSGNGSGDFANLTSANAFMELPLNQNEFKRGEVYPIWPFKKMF